MDIEKNNMLTFLLGKLAGRKLNVLDIGVRFGVSNAFRFARSQGMINIFGLEPFPEECERLKQLQPDVTFIPKAVSDTGGLKELYVTRHPGASSCLEPDMSVLAPFPIREYFEVVQKLTIETTTIDELVATGQIQQPDLIKIDVQGYEWHVLNGAINTLKNTSVIELESHFLPIYKGQKLLHEVYAFLASHGFILRDLHPQGPFEGQVVEVEAYFAKNSPDVNINPIVKFFEFALEVNSPPTLAHKVVMEGDSWPLRTYLTQDHINNNLRWIL